MTWEDTLESWAKGPSPTEEQKCENAESVISRIIRNDPKLSLLSIRVFTQGSYRAGTNVRLDSDVDICVCLMDTFFYDLAFSGSQEPQDHEIGPATMDYPEFKDLVGAALVRALGREGVKRGNKAFDVHANTYRIDADVVPAFEHRRYLRPRDRYGSPQYLSGIEFRPDNGEQIINWPEQAYQNGVAKNDSTRRRYKRTIRILKRMRNAMQGDHISAAKDIGSFLIESLVWNAPDDSFSYARYTDILHVVLAHTFNSTLTQEACSEWGEVNELKYLFRGGQPWTREQAHNFLSAAWDYIGFD